MSAQFPHAVHLSSLTCPGFLSISKLKFPAFLSDDLISELVMISILLCCTASFISGLKRHNEHSSASFSGENTLPIFIMFPPTVGLSSIICTLTPCFASESAAVIPDIPPPITAALFLVFLTIASRGLAYWTLSTAAFVSDIAFSVALFLSECTHEQCSLIFAISKRYGFNGAI